MIFKNSKDIKNVKVQEVYEIFKKIECKKDIIDSDNKKY